MGWARMPSPYNVVLKMGSAALTSTVPLVWVARTVGVVVGGGRAAAAIVSASFIVGSSVPRGRPFFFASDGSLLGTIVGSTASFPGGSILGVGSIPRTADPHASIFTVLSSDLSIRPRIASILGVSLLGLSIPATGVMVAPDTGLLARVPAAIAWPRLVHGVSLSSAIKGGM